MTDLDLDRADEAHAVLASLPAELRIAAAALLALPEDLPLAHVADDDTGHVVGHLTAEQLLFDLRTGVAGPDTVLEILRQRRCLLPGLAGT